MESDDLVLAVVPHYSNLPMSFIQCSF